MDLLGLHKMRHIGNVHADLESAVVELVDVECVIEVTSRLGVDGEDPALPEVLPGVNLGLGNGPRNGR